MSLSDDPVPPQPQPRAARGPLLAAAGAVAALVIVAVALLVTDRGGGGGGDDDVASAVGGALGTPPTTMPSNAGTVAPATTTETEGEVADHAPAGAGLPAVTIPPEASPPTTAPGQEPGSIPGDILTGEEIPEFGTIVVDLDEGAYQDFAVHLREDQEVTLLSLGDDGIETEIEVFAPDGTSEGWWEGGEPGVVNGLEWYAPDDPVPATGTYVIRVIHTGGSHEPFALGFFGDA
jgi:hypothetical protein